MRGPGSTYTVQPTRGAAEQYPKQEEVKIHKRCLCLPLVKGALLITLLTFVRATLFTLALSGKLEEFISMGHGMLQYLVVILVIGDSIMGAFGVYGVIMKNLDFLQGHGYWRLISLLFLVPGICSHMLFDEKVLHHIQHQGVFVVAFAFLLAIILEAWFCFQLFRHILSIMSEEQVESSVVGRVVGSAKWLQDKEQRVFCNSMSITSAVGLFCVAMVLTSTIGFFALIFLPGQGWTMGFYSSVNGYTRVAFLLLDTLGMYFGFLGLLALRRRWTMYMQQFFWFSVVKLCLTIPMVGWSFVNNNICDVKSQGLTQVELNEKKIVEYPISCSQREQIYLIFVGVGAATWGYLLHLTYVLLERYQYVPLMKAEAEGEKV